ncbi:MAG: gliding motility lipoprotein GldD [Flavobacteriaceae bacterium]|nr:gliding motility lipoprotein GldD [Flavobacteriaceae bacterium]
MRIVIKLILAVLFVSCGSDAIPKPKAYLRLEYPKPEYVVNQTILPFSFEKNSLASDISEIKISRDGNTQGVNLEYPSIKGTIYITYKAVKDDIKVYLLDAQNLTQKHTQKADAISGERFVDEEHKVYGMFYDVGGNAASQSQFYATDSINHFVTGALYFNVKPNYDSILPAANYLKEDIRRIMETIRWKK